jgi:CRP-like cAMP-binding protein
MSQQSGNRILASLSRKDRDLLERDLEAIDLPVRRPLVQRHRRVEHVYFMDSGIASIVADAGGQPIEIGIIGREGFSSVGVVMGSDRSEHDVFMQVGGAGKRIRAEILVDANERSITLQRVLMRYAHTLFVQVSQTAVANGKSKIDERLARWLLLAHDRVDGDTIAMTHEFLSVMLATPRPGVTVAVGELAEAGLIETSRGRITILNRAGLEAMAKGIYDPPADDS